MVTAMSLESVQGVICSLPVYDYVKRYFCEGLVSISSQKCATFIYEALDCPRGQTDRLYHSKGCL